MAIPRQAPRPKACASDDEVDGFDGFGGSRRYRCASAASYADKAGPALSIGLGSGENSDYLLLLRRELVEPWTELELESARFLPEQLPHAQDAQKLRALELEKRGRRPST